MNRRPIHAHCSISSSTFPKFRCLGCSFSREGVALVLPHRGKAATTSWHAVLCLDFSFSLVCAPFLSLRPLLAFARGPCPQRRYAIITPYLHFRLVILSLLSRSPPSPNPRSHPLSYALIPQISADKCDLQMYDTHWHRQELIQYFAYSYGRQMRLSSLACTGMPQEHISIIKSDRRTLRWCCDRSSVCSAIVDRLLI